MYNVTHLYMFIKSIDLVRRCFFATKTSKDLSASVTSDEKIN